MTNVAVIGAQWGDEGKGKVTDYLADSSKVVARSQGGNNAGHTVVDPSGAKYAFHLLPSGVVHPGVQGILGNGVVIDPWALLNEIEDIRKQGIDVTEENFMISESASLILPFHQ